jgi:hypothetical protein
LADTRTDAQKRKKVFVKATLLIKIMVLLIGSAGIFSEVTNPKQETLDWGKKGGGNTQGAQKKRFWCESIFSCNRRLRESFSYVALG